jgi:cytochrome b
MVLLLLLSLAATTVAGMTLYALIDDAGPLAGLVASDGDATTTGEASDETRMEFWEETHELLANLTLLLVILHTAGVIVASRAHRENLVKAMFTGKKRSADTR